MLATKFCRMFFKHIWFNISRAAAKNRSIHTYEVIWINWCVLNCTWCNYAQFALLHKQSRKPRSSYLTPSIKVCRNVPVLWATGWSRKNKTEFLNFKLLCKKYLKSNLRIILKVFHWVKSKIQCIVLYWIFLLWCVLSYIRKLCVQSALY